MDKQLQSKILSILNGLSDKALSAFELGKKEIPDILQQLLRYKLIENLVYLVISIVVLSVICPKVFKVFVKQGETNNDGYQFLLGIIFAGLTLGGILIFFSTLQETMQVCFAPKLYLLEYIKGML